LRSGLHVPGRQGRLVSACRLLQSTVAVTRSGEREKGKAARLIKRVGRHRVRRAGRVVCCVVGGLRPTVVDLLSSALAFPKVREAPAGWLPSRRRPLVASWTNHTIFLPPSCCACHFASLHTPSPPLPACLPCPFLLFTRARLCLRVPASLVAGHMKCAGC
jgi:hypothetical protein